MHACTKVEISKENKYIHISHNHVLLISSIITMLAFNAYAPEKTLLNKLKKLIYMLNSYKSKIYISII
jgi:hypothetical protein